MSELDFLLELLLNHKLTKPTKDLLQARIKEVQVRPNSMQTSPQGPYTMQSNGNMQPMPTMAQAQAVPATQAPGTVVAGNPATQQALRDRAALLNGHASGLNSKGGQNPKPMKNAQGG